MNDMLLEIELLKLEIKTLEDEYKFCKSEDEQQENINNRQDGLRKALFLLETYREENSNVKQ